jgi:serine beta-lactamase-like protein LACTB
MVPLMAVIAVLPALAQSGKLPTDERAKIDDAVAHFMAKSSAPGVAVAVVEDGEFAWAAGYGLADLENQVPVTPETLFRLASVSKPISAVAAMQLWEQGKLDLDTPIQRYCPAFPNKGALITTRELLGHLGGIRHYLKGPAGEAEVNNTTHFADPIAGGLSFFKNDALVYPPGTHYSYSTQGYTLVGCAIAAASGEPYTDEVRQRVLVPAGMTATQVDDRFAVIPHRTRFYHLDAAGHLVNAEFLDSSYKIPGGGWLSSVADMARFEVALLADSLVKPATFALMTTPLRPSDGSDDHYGLGFSVSALDGTETVSHGGGQQGTSTAMLLFPSRRAGVVVLVNLDESGAGELADEVARIVLAGQ